MTKHIIIIRIIKTWCFFYLSANVNLPGLCQFDWGGHGGLKFAISVLYRDKYFFWGEGAVSGLVFILINRGNERATVDRKGYY